ncbi:hypothetical protein NQ315_001340 [Exocentrus adspersus]|uniref:Death domain-containing protein n=1 Tax=Exocentrus adspersus TaxID=1586481 RepID=A0AAV8WG83_9CUCU|nr:hypothetical protein NQ315_001340 [Exocentrus adspersus]
MYIYHLPYEERKQLCHILDQNNRWEELGGSQMQYDMLTIESIRKEVYRGNSPSSELLTIWGHQNHTVLELFILLYRMKHYQAMTVIKKFVEEKYHCLIKDGEDLDALVRNLALNKKESNKCDSKIQQENFDCASEKILNAPQVLGLQSRESNESLVNPRLLQPRSPLPLGRLGTSKLFTAMDISNVAESAGPIPHILSQIITERDPFMRGLLYK